MKNPAVVPFKCLDTFALEGVARTFGSGAAGVRLAHDRLEKHVRPSRRRRQNEAVQIDALIAAELDHGALQAGAPVSAALVDAAQNAPRVSLPRAPEARRASMPSLVAIDAVGTSLRRPTTWAVLLLTLGISFGVVLARVASNAASSEFVGPPPVSNAAPTRAMAAVPLAPRTTAVSPPVAPITLATTRIVGRRHHHHGPPAESATPADVESTPSATAGATDTPPPPHVTRTSEAETTPLPASPPRPGASDDEAAAAAAERVHRELSDSL